MRVAALYDIHGNLPALDAVLTEVEGLGVDAILVGGDVMPGPMPRACLDRLLALTVPVRFILGNGDREAVAHRAGGGTATLPEGVRGVLRWTGTQLDDALAHSIAAWPLTLELRGLGSVLFCHATPRNDTEIFTRLTPEAALLPVFGGVDASVVVCGHTHMPFDRRVGPVRVVNPGSVGMPFGEPGAHWLQIASSPGQAAPDVTWRHTMYDLAAAADIIRATNYPQAAEFAATNVLNPPTEAAMLAALGRAAIS